MIIFEALQLQGNQWIPDYTLTAVTDTTYLKVRRNTYMVAVKATKMESSSNYQEWKEEELDEVLVKITENDDDFCLRSSQQCVRSPDSSWARGVTPGQTPGGSRRTRYFAQYLEKAN